MPTEGCKVKKFVDFDGWHTGIVSSYVERANTINVQLTNGAEEQWTLEEYISQQQISKIPVGGIGYLFVEPFSIEGVVELFNGKVVRIREDQRCVCQYNDSTKEYT